MPLLGGSRERLAEEPTRVGFRRLEASDLPMIHRWPHTPHVARWWYEDTGPYEKVARHYSAYIEGEEPFEPYLILHDGRPVGYVQWYRVSEDEEYGELVGIEDAAGIDLFIGERSALQGARSARHKAFHRGPRLRGGERRDLYHRPGAGEQGRHPGLRKGRFQLL